MSDERVVGSGRIGAEEGPHRPVEILAVRHLANAIDLLAVRAHPLCPARLDRGGQVGGCVHVGVRARHRAPPGRARDVPRGPDPAPGRRLARRPGRRPPDRAGPDSGAALARTEARPRVASGRGRARSARNRVRPESGRVAEDDKGRRRCRCHRREPDRQRAREASPGRGCGPGARPASDTPVSMASACAPSTTTTSARPAASSASSTRCRTGRPASAASSLAPPKREPAPAARTTALTVAASSVRVTRL